MMKSRERYFWAASFLFVAMAAAVPYVLAPEPFRDVRVVDSHQDGPWQYITVNFVKGPCERLDVVMLGHRFGLSDNLTRTWQSIDGAPDGHDRLQGVQTLSGRLYVGAIEYESIEIRTRHLCDGKRVDRTFVTIVPE